MYDTMRKDHYWTHMANKVYTTVRDCRKCVQDKLSDEHRCPLHSFPTNRRLEFVVRNILGPLQKMSNGNQIVVVMEDRYSNLTKAVPTFNTTTAHIALILLDHWIIPCETHDHMLTDSGAQFIGKVIEFLCAFLRTKLQTTAVYHPQMNGKAEIINKTVIARQAHSIADHQQDWDIYV